ncbi:TIGR03089 family protein [Mycobacterium tuberculosis]|uniref:TIGR03089 family protein n=1 Tax=Mycobacterium tuberculosis TaxID=1773 RepID=A0A655IKY8_MYCTX|nr:TIGR03089 family protein [Mycobacterium tuberculosis]
MHQLTTPTTLSGAILDPMLRADPVGPRITYYDDATGERIELSAVTLANWAAKTGNLLRDELAAADAAQSRRICSTDLPASTGPGLCSGTIWSPCTRTAVA